MPGKCASMLQLLPSAGKPRSAPTEDRRVVKAGVISEREKFCRSVGDIIHSDLSQNPGEICQKSPQLLTISTKFVILI